VPHDVLTLVASVASLTHRRRRHQPLSSRRHISHSWPQVVVSLILASALSPAVCASTISLILHRQVADAEELALELCKTTARRSGGDLVSTLLLFSLPIYV
jgi:hypothetical protein